MLTAAGVAAGALPYPSVTRSRADEPTVSVNSSRDGWDPGETTGSLTPAALLSGSFGELFSAQVDGQVYAQPLALDAYHELIVATENDWVYGLDQTTGKILWKSYLPALVDPGAPGTPWPASAENCTDLAPNVGVTSTPVYDPAVSTATPNGAVYLVSEEVPAGAPVTAPVFYMHAIDPVTGQEIQTGAQPGWPVQIKGAPANDPTAPFSAFTEIQRPGLLLTGGMVFAAFAGHCDFSPYDGYVAAVSTGTRAQTIWTDEAGLTSQNAGIWQSGGGLVSDGPGRIILATGNGISPAPGPGSAPPGQLAESVVRLAVQSNGTLAAQDFFSPANAPFLDSIDGDLGAGGPAQLPFGTATLADLIIQIGKDGRAFVLNGNSLGGRDQGAGNTDAAVSVNGPWGPGEWGHPAAYADTPALTPANVAASNDYVYFVSKNGPLHFLRAGLNGAGALVLSNVAQSSDTYGYTAGSAVVTSDGTGPGANSSAIVWVVNTKDQIGATGALEAYPAVPDPSCTAAAPCSEAPLWQFPLTRVGKFTTPATDDGRVYIATRGPVSNGANCPAVPSGDPCGQVLGFGSPSTAPLGGASPVSFTNVAVGSSSATNVTVTASATVSVSQPTATGPGFSVAGPFTYTPSGGAPAPVTSWPVSMSAGDTLEADGVTFSPASPGAVTGALQFGTDAGNFPTVNVPLSGNGTQVGFVPSAASQAFTSVPVGTTSQVTLTVANDNTVAENLSVPALSAPFSVTGPGTGSPVAVAPGTSVSLTVSYHPTGTSGDSATLTLNDTTDSVAATVPLTGAGVADISPTLTAVPAGISFGSVHLGQQAQQVVVVTNTGNLPATISGVVAPSIPFGAPDPVTSGLPVNPGYSISIPITFTPASTGNVSASYQLNWADAVGQHTITIPVSGAGVAPSGGIAIPPPGGGWTFNGSAGMTGTIVNLNSLTANTAGSVVYAKPVGAAGIKATFTVKIGGGTNGAGLTMSLIDAAKTGQSAIGGTAGALGFGGLPGVAVTLDTAKYGTHYPSANFAGIATGFASGQLNFAATSTKVPALRTGTHVIGVTTAAATGGLTTITVTVDGKQYLSKAVAVPKLVRLAFTAATGATTDRHQITAATITAGGAKIPPPGGGWSYNASAGQQGPDTAVVPVVVGQAGTVVYPTPLTTAGLHVTFNLQLCGGTGGEGMTLALLNPAATTATSVGGTGPLVGAGGLKGVFVLFGIDHTIGSPWPKTDFVATSLGNESTDGLGTLAIDPQFVAQGLSSLRCGGTHTATVTVVQAVVNGASSDVLSVWLDGVRVLQDAEPRLTATVRLAFTAANGSARTDADIVRDVAVAASSTG